MKSIGNETSHFLHLHCHPPLPTPRINRFPSRGVNKLPPSESALPSLSLPNPSLHPPSLHLPISLSPSLSSPTCAFNVQHASGLPSQQFRQKWSMDFSAFSLSPSKGLRLIDSLAHPYVFIRVRPRAWIRMQSGRHFHKRMYLACTFARQPGREKRRRN